ncbi:hypothetical protein PISMIDRAFT_682739 [Pisolithus microcarpus 441]|uniref:Uncharacterized protein n=1 Tax=Pisolithus microcarpus 441 TaxID=765257 RepID=A0A0C9Y5K8_9AGAM|nr:hypothetical protein BKA83DRAFT_682739 [Pisolithus microcarpus]KIK19985.1 hypothetical protein PISMIDRAFT_682739 [Pisolithus microcarpus 441]
MRYPPTLRRLLSIARSHHYVFGDVSETWHKGVPPGPHDTTKDTTNSSLAVGLHGHL